MKLYTIKKDSTFLVETFTVDQLNQPDPPRPEEVELTEVTTETPLTLTEDRVVYEGPCSDPECGCETVNFQLPLVRYYVDRSDVVISEVVSQ